MGDKTGIEWTDATWNPTVGCSIVSPGCANCYAMKMAARLEAMGRPAYKGLTRKVNGNAVWTGAVRLNEGALELPLRWRKPRRIFVNSMSDLFHEALPDEAIDRVFAVMALCQRHTFQVLTKRPERMRAHLVGVMRDQELGISRFGATALWTGLHGPAGQVPDWPLPNVWLGVSAEDQARADERIPILLDTPAALRFISAEPRLRPVDLTALSYGGWPMDALRGVTQNTVRNDYAIPHLDWVIAGGESGPDARPCHPDWIRNLRDQCMSAGVPFFFKQWGEWAPVPHRDDLRGRPQMVRQGDMMMLVDGRTEILPGTLGSELEKIGGTPLRRVGKKAAGAMLDGRAHREFPTMSDGDVLRRAQRTAARTT